MQAFEAEPKRFSSGSVGWHYSGKVMIDGVRVQVSLSLVVVGSKPIADKEVDAGGGVTLIVPDKAPRRLAKPRGKPKATEDTPEA